MHSTSAKPILHGYSVIRISLDDDRNDTVPVGVVAWQSTRPWYGWRWLASDEKVRGVDRSMRKLLRITKRQISRWADSRRVPYEPGPVEPTSDTFWKAASEILTTAVQLDRPKAMDPMREPTEGIEALFEAVVQPGQSQRKQTQRIDTQLSGALGKLAQQIPKKPRVSAFGGAEEQVWRGLVTDRGVLLVDGVNLAKRDARTEADALVSRFLRIGAAYQNRPVRFIVGYSSSPGGLNGESHMRDWIRAKLTDQVFDLTTQKTEFQEATADAWRQFDDEAPRPLFRPDRNTR